MDKLKLSYKATAQRAIGHQSAQYHSQVLDPSHPSVCSLHLLLFLKRPKLILKTIDPSPTLQPSKPTPMSLRPLAKTVEPFTRANGKPQRSVRTVMTRMVV